MSSSRTPRAPGPLTIAPAVSDALSMLLELRRVLDEPLGIAEPCVPLAPTLSYEDVVALEASLVVHLPDDLLALFATGVFSMASVARLDHEANRRRWPSAERGSHGRLLYVGEDVEDHRVFAIPRLREAARVVHVHTFEREAMKDHGDVRRLEAWLVRERERNVARFELGEDARKRIEVAPTRGTIAPVLVARARVESPDPAPVKRWVRHGKFGLGTVTRQVNADTLEVAFEEVGTKVVLRRFVTDVSEDR